MNLLRLHASRLPLAAAALVLALLLAGANGCSSDPNVEGAKLELRNQDYDRVIELTGIALAQNPENAEAYFLRGEAYRLKAEDETDAEARRELVGQMQEAYAAARNLGYDAATLENRAAVAWGQEMNAGTRAFRRASEDPTAYADAIVAFESATAILPDSSTGWLNHGLALLAAGRTAEAAAPLQQAIDRGADSPEAYIYLGRIYLSEDRGQEALTALEQAAQLYPEHEEIQTEILNAYGATGQTERAIEAYDEALQRDPENALYRYNYGSLLLQTERFDEAIEQLEHATALDPSNPNAFYNLGAAYQNKAASLNEHIEQLEEANAEQAEIDAALAERHALLEQAVTPLEGARAAAEAEGESAADICRALFQVYASLDRLEEANEAAECAGIDMN